MARKPTAISAPTLYGWRQYGDYGVVDGGFVNLYPTYYTAKLMQDFVQPGDTVISRRQRLFAALDLCGPAAGWQPDGSDHQQRPREYSHRTGGGGQLSPRHQAARSIRTGFPRTMPRKPASARRTLRKPTCPVSAQTSTTLSRLTRPPCWHSHRRRQNYCPSRSRRPAASSFFNSRVRPAFLTSFKARPI